MPIRPAGSECLRQELGDQGDGARGELGQQRCQQGHQQTQPSHQVNKLDNCKINGQLLESHFFLIIHVLWIYIKLEFFGATRL